MASNKLRTRVVYTSEAVDQMTDAEVRKAYTSIRHIAVERFNRLERSGFAKTNTYKNAARQGGFPKISELTPSDLRQKLLDTSLFLRAPYSKLTRMRQRTAQAAKTLHKNYPWINKNNVIDALNFLNDMQENYAEKNYSYERVVEAYNTAQRLDIPEDLLREKFEQYMQNLDKLKDLPDDVGASSGDVRKLLDVNKKTKKRKRR